MMNARALAVFLLLTNTIHASEACEISYYKIGCYSDPGNPRTFPHLLLNARYPGAKNNPGYTIAWDIQKYQEFLPRFICDCAKAAGSSGTKYFGIQYYAECWSGIAGAELDFGKLRLSNSCVNLTFGPCQADSEQCSGVGLTNMIYYMPDKSKVETTSKVTAAVSTKLSPTTTEPPPRTTKPQTTTEPLPTATEPPPRTTESQTTTEPPKTTKFLTTIKPPPKTTESPPTTTEPPITTTKPPTTTTNPPTTTEPPTTTKSPTTKMKPPKTTTKPPTTTEPPTTTPNPPTTTTEPPTSTVIRTENVKKPGCMKNADILIALDISSSISLDEFEKRKQLLADFVARFPVNENEVHFALIHYNHIIHTDFTFEDPHFYNVGIVQKTILQVPLLGGATLTQEALNQAFRVFSMPQYGARSTSKKILIIVTDGYTYGGEEILELPSLKLQFSGVNIVAVGFGERTNLVGLRMMSSNILTLDNMLQKTGDELLQYLAMLVHAVCESPSKTM